MSEEGLSERTKAIARQKIHPIVEFFPIDWDHESKGHFLDTNEPDRVLLRKDLQKAKGLYAFYNSEYEIIYLGKTKNNLWSEMKNAYDRKMPHYSRFVVAHPRDRYVAPKNGLVRPIRQKTFLVSDAATFFSAYAVEDDDLIDLVELMLIRMLPNDLLNKRMEANTTLQPYCCKDTD